VSLKFYLQKLYNSYKHQLFFILLLKERVATKNFDSIITTLRSLFIFNAISHGITSSHHILDELLMTSRFMTLISFFLQLFCFVNVSLRTLNHSFIRHFCQPKGLKFKSVKEEKVPWWANYIKKAQWATL